MSEKGDEISHVRKILGFVGGGVHKRIDENRELLQLLQRDAPDFLRDHWWIEGWLSSNDEFFVALASSVPITEGRFLGLLQGRLGKWSRAWLGLANGHTPNHAAVDRFVSSRPAKQGWFKKSWLFKNSK